MATGWTGHRAQATRARTTTDVQIGLPRPTDFATVQYFVQLPPIVWFFWVSRHRSITDVEDIPSRPSAEDTNPWHQVRRRKPSKPRVTPPEGTRSAQPSAANPASPTPVLKGAVPIKRCVLFVGGIDIDCDEAALIKYCRSKNVRVSSCRFPKSKLFGTKSARLSVSVEDAEAANILDEEFWPDNITARPWKFPPRLGRPDTEILQTSTLISSSWITTEKHSPDPVHQHENLTSIQLNPNAPTFTPSSLLRTNCKAKVESLKLIFTNARRIHNKIHELTELINSEPSSTPDVIAISKSWLNASVPDSCLTTHFLTQVFRTDRSSASVSPSCSDNRRGGGVLFLVRDSLKSVPPQRWPTVLAGKCVDRN